MDIEKRREHWRKWYHNNKEKARAARERTRERLYNWFLEYKSKQKCCKCGNSDPRVLDFHHRDPSTKKYNISDLRRRGTQKKLEEEIKKCDVYCANCHRIETYGEWSSKV